MNEMDIDLTYEPHERILDAVSYSLAFTVVMVGDILRGDITFNFAGLFHGRPSAQALFFVIFLSGLLIVCLVAVADKLIVVNKRKIIPVVIGSFIAAVILVAYTSIFFSRPGSWIVSWGLGGAGGMLSLMLYFAIYFFVVLIARAFLAIKKRLHRNFNTSIALFLTIFMLALPKLYFIFFTAR